MSSRLSNLRGGRVGAGFVDSTKWSDGDVMEAGAGGGGGAHPGRRGGGHVGRDGVLLGGFFGTTGFSRLGALSRWWIVSHCKELGRVVGLSRSGCAGLSRLSCAELSTWSEVLFSSEASSNLWLRPPMEMV